MSPDKPTGGRFCVQCSWQTDKKTKICPICGGKEFIEGKLIRPGEPIELDGPTLSLSQFLLIVTFIVVLFGFIHLLTQKEHEFEFFFEGALVSVLSFSLWIGLFTARHAKARSENVDRAFLIGLCFTFLVSFSGPIAFFFWCSHEFSKGFH
jgi:hypothetical protein